jgi:L-lactate dehydrogenase
LVGFGNIGRCVMNILLQDEKRQFHINVMDPSPTIAGSLRDLGHSIFLTKRHRLSLNDSVRFNQANFIIYAAGSAIPLGKSREYALRDNVRIATEVFRGFIPLANPVLINVSNPVDALTYVLLRLSGLTPDNVVGVGTLVETIRLEYQLAVVSGADPSQIKALVIGEHGETAVPVLSHTFINGVPVAHAIHEELIRDAIYECRRAAYRIKETQGASYFGAANAAVHVLKAYLSLRSDYLPLSILDAQAGIYYSMPVRHCKGLLEPLVLSLDTSELEALEESKGKVAMTTAIAFECLEPNQVRS